VRRLARELGVDLSGVTGSGRKGRITKEDVEKRRVKRAGGGCPAKAAAAERAGAIAGLNLAAVAGRYRLREFGAASSAIRSRASQKISGPPWRAMGDAPARPATTTRRTSPSSEAIRKPVRDERGVRHSRA
jgi:pyruvate/2-oxoglutarate dehydrogenase complex dihydrolipoamide acyltransferase (E2) component